MEKTHTTKMTFGFERLKERVIDRGLCTACGTCAGICPTKGITFQRFDGEPLPVLVGKCSECGTCEAVCPGEEVDLYQLELDIFGRLRNLGSPRNPEELHLGVFQDAYQGWALNPKIREQGAGGGVVTALLAWALESGYLDGVIVAGFDPEKPWQTQPFLARTPEEVLKYAQSKYAVVTINSLLQEAIQSGCERLGIVGLPCQVQALRKMMALERPKKIAERIKLILGLFCASQFYFEGTLHLLKEQGNIQHLEEIETLSYRGGDYPGHLIIVKKNGDREVIDRHHYMYHSLMPAFKRDRCEMCVDWASELADISVGDYWVPDGQRKSSSLLVRSDIGLEILSHARTSGGLQVEPINPQKLYSGIGFELKKHAAAFRLKQRARFNWPTPNYHMEVDYSPVTRPLHLAKEAKPTDQK